MRRLNRPTEAAGDVYRLCISRVRDATLKARLAAEDGRIEAAAGEFHTQASASSTHTLPPSTVVGAVTSEEMEDVYSQRMAKRGSPGRPTYDRLMALPEHGRCPLCGHGAVSTIDHYLPKTRFPALVVAPGNLVAACADCNKNKGDHRPTREEDQTLHPYYDDVDSGSWLAAEVLETTPAAVRFHVIAPAGWSAAKVGRVEHHFRLLRLAALYSSNAASELVSIRHRLEQLHKTGGEDQVREDLLRDATSREKVARNSWQGAMYRALAASDWFCDGGFRE